MSAEQPNSHSVPQTCATVSAEAVAAAAAAAAAAVVDVFGSWLDWWMVLDLHQHLQLLAAAVRPVTLFVETWDAASAPLPAAAAAAVVTQLSRLDGLHAAQAGLSNQLFAFVGAAGQSLMLLLSALDNCVTQKSEALLQGWRQPGLQLLGW